MNLKFTPKDNQTFLQDIKTALSTELEKIKKHTTFRLLRWSATKVFIN